MSPIWRPDYAGPKFLEAIVLSRNKLKINIIASVVTLLALTIHTPDQMLLS